jgi:uncharacterized RDD family membrane protein YckC
MEVIDQEVGTRSVAYAGFWERFGAALIDGILMGVVGMAVGLAMGEGTFEANDNGFTYRSSDLIGTIIGIFYYVGMETSKHQATLGKKALNLKVTDMDGNRLTIGRSIGRYFAKILSAMILLIGYLMQPFTQKKQALHDMLAGTLVVKDQQ